MTKAELEVEVKERLLKNPKLTAVDAVIEEITAQLELGNEITIREFGTFSMRKQVARKARNFQINEMIEVPEKWKAIWKASKKIVLRQATLNPTAPAGTNVRS